jgi:hypothetical protein
VLIRDLFRRFRQWKQVRELCKTNEILSRRARTSPRQSSTASSRIECLHRRAALIAGASRSAERCRSPRQHIGVTRHVRAILRCCQREPGVMLRCCPRCSGGTADGLTLTMDVLHAARAIVAQRGMRAQHAPWSHDRRKACTHQAMGPRCSCWRSRRAHSAPQSLS